MNSSPDRIRILAVDDDEALLGIFAVALTRAGFEVRTTPHAEGALTALDSFAPALVLLDVSMPDMSGWEIVRRIRLVSDVPVMFVSGCDDETDKARGLDLGADDYLTKPFSMIELEARVRALLRRARVRERAHVG